MGGYRRGSAPPQAMFAEHRNKASFSTCFYIKRSFLMSNNLVHVCNRRNHMQTLNLK